jgi:hypothetical protein
MTAGDRMTAAELAREILAGVAFTAHGPIWVEREGSARVRLEDLLAFYGYGEPIQHGHRFECADTPGTFECSCGWTAHVLAEHTPDSSLRGYCVHPDGGRPAFIIGDWDELRSGGGPDAR